MPAIKASHRWAVIIMIKIVDQFVMGRIIRISQIWCVIILFHGFSIHLFGKAPGTSKVIFRSCSADGRILLISVNIKFNFAFSPPVSFKEPIIRPADTSPANFPGKLYIICKRRKHRPDMGYHQRTAPKYGLCLRTEPGRKRRTPECPASRTQCSKRPLRDSHLH